MILFDFSQTAAIDDWPPVNDAVMGGRSTSGLKPSGAGTAVFSGRVSLENGGGFASIRAKPRQHDLRESAGLSLRVRGDDHRYKLNLKTDPTDVLYRVVFETRRDVWQTSYFPFDQFEPTFRGRDVPGAPPLDRSRIVSVGLMISDRQEGPFQLEIAWIRAEPRQPSGPGP